MDDRQRAFRMVSVSHETQARLDIYIDLLRKWQDRTNLVAPSTMPVVWTRHVADSLQLLPLAPEAKRWVDIGSGGGFPGVVLACALADEGGHVHLVERNAKKAAFLREALRVTGGAGTVVVGDITDCGGHIPSGIEIVTARAVAPLATLIGWSEVWLRGDTRGLFLKGQDVAEELKDLPISCRFRFHFHKSVTGSGQIVDVTAVAPERR